MLMVLEGGLGCAEAMVKGKVPAIECEGLNWNSRDLWGNRAGLQPQCWGDKRAETGRSWEFAR